MERGSIHGVVGGGAVEAALPPAPARAGHSSTPRPPTPPPPLGEGQRSESNAEFLARQVAAEESSGVRQTFARFTIDPETHRVSVHIIDANTKEVVRSIPGDELRRMAHRYQASQGVLLDSAV